MHQSTHTQRLARVGLSLLLTAAGTACAQVPAATAALPDGWQPLALPTVSGDFRQTGGSDTAMLVKKSDHGPYGVAVVPAAASGGQASIVKTFTDIKANPPQLALVKPGNYQPACHGSGCATQAIATEAISLCFGEASCQIIYYNGNRFRELAVAD